MNYTNPVNVAPIKAASILIETENRTVIEINDGIVDSSTISVIAGLRNKTYDLPAH
jgi:hypothetical protein